MDEVIEQRLLQLQPQVVLECSGVPWPGVTDRLASHGISHDTIDPKNLVEQDATRRYDLALVHHALEDMSLTEGEQLLARLRNAWAERIWLLLDPHAHWPFARLLALSFKRDDSDELSKTDFTHYTYDIGSYNHKRTWNNPRFWANPENFHKYRW